MATKHPHPQQAASQLMHEEKSAESAMPEPVPTLEQETPALVLTSSTPTVEVPVELGAVSHSEPLQPHETLPLMTSVTPTAAPEAAEAPQSAPPAQPAIEETVPEKSILPFPVTTATAQVEFSESNKAASDLISSGEASETGEKRETREHQEAQQPQPASIIELPDLVANGLIMVETMAEKIKQNETQAEAESTLPQRRRKRPSAVPVIAHEEPMVQIETHK
jgi:ribonuclease E